MLYGNPLGTPPPEILLQGQKALESYYRSTKSGTIPLNEVKVILVGDGGAGKTSLVKRVVGESFSFDESQTHGINIKNWKFKWSGQRIKARIWDFGGQEIMHATHQFFLSQRSMYVLVLDSRKDEKTEYWLQHIQTFGTNSPVLIVINKIDENPGFDVNQRFLRQKYPNIIGFYRISCKTNQGVEEFTSKLRQNLTRLKHVNTEWAVSWFTVKEKLERIEHDFISLNEFKELCNDEGVNHPDDQNILISLLHDLGIIISFNDLPLRDTNVINPRWITSGVYKIINSEILAEGDGILPIKNMVDALDISTHPLETHNFIIELMRKFELCYFMDSNHVLVPSLLPVEEPSYTRNESDSLFFIISYGFLPKSIIARFIVRMHNDILDNTCWRTGVVLRSSVGDAQAFVRADDDRKKMEFQIWGQGKRDYLAVLVHTIRTINTSFSKIEADERVPLPDNRSVTVSLNHLLLLESRGVQSFFPEGANQEYDVSELLGQIRVKQTPDTEILTLLKEIKDNQDTEDTLKEKANQIIELKPNFFGLGVNLNALIKEVLQSSKE